MYNDSNKAVVRRWLDELWNARRLDIAPEIFSDRYVRHDPAMDVRGLGGLTAFVSRYLEAFPDLHFVEESMIAEGDLVAVRWTATGTHTGRFGSLRPTHRRGTISGMDFFRLESGLIVESWPGFDRSSLLEQLGVTPTSVRSMAKIALGRAVDAARAYWRAFRGWPQTPHQGAPAPTRS